MTWKGAGLLLVLIILLGGTLAYADKGLTLNVLNKFGLANEYSRALLGVPEASQADKRADFERGPHNGRLLRDGDFALEVTIFETGVPPEFHFYVYERGKQVSPSDVELGVELGRLGGDTENLTFTPQGDYLKSNDTVLEPHSFDVTVTARHAGKGHRWSYSSYEGRTEIAEVVAKAVGVATEQAGPASIREIAVLNGSIVLNQNKTTNVKARFPGVVREVLKNVGETVSEGDVLAMVESNNSLLQYPVKAPFGGIVLERATNVGDVTGEAPLFVISDLSSVWAEFHVFSRDLMRVKAGQPIRVKSLQGEGEIESTVTLFTPLAEFSSQSVIARVTLENADGRWRPGMTVRGEAAVAEHDVAVAVKTAALQRFRDFTVVFAKVGATYEVRMLDLGFSDGTWTEVKGGLKAGTTYVTENSFLVKADVEKSGASHDH